MTTFTWDKQSSDVVAILMCDSRANIAIAMGHEQYSPIAKRLIKRTLLTHVDKIFLCLLIYAERLEHGINKSSDVVAILMSDSRANIATAMGHEQCSPIAKRLIRTIPVGYVSRAFFVLSCGFMMNYVKARGEWYAVSVYERDKFRVLWWFADRQGSRASSFYDNFPSPST